MIRNVARHRIVGGDFDTMEHSRKPTLMQLRTSLPKKIVITIGIMLALIAFVYFFKVPNPNMILIAGLVFCSAVFGFGGGIVAAAIMLGYTLFFFSTDHSFTQFTPENLQKVGVSLIGITADMLLVCFLKQAEIQAFKKVDDLTEQLRAENEHLQNISLYDPLTGIKNRLALRQDYDTYYGHDVTVMMLDINKFKTINDTYGHGEGDRILKESGALMSEIFGKEYCYRYGGDEFVVILPDVPEDRFRDKLELLMGKGPVLETDGVWASVEYSAGYIHDKLDDTSKLREMLSAADERMYQAKRSKGLDSRE